MKLHFSNEWLRRSIASDPDVDIEAGPPLHAIFDQLDSLGFSSNQAQLGDRAVVRLRVALGTLVRDLRMSRSLTLEELASQANVPVDELHLVEHDPHYTARPRLIHQLSEFFGVALAGLAQLSGTTGTVDRSLYNRAVRYAASSDERAQLTPAQQELLDAFVALLNAKGSAT